MLNKWRIRVALWRMRRAVRAGRLTIVNPALDKGPNAVSVRGIPDGLIFSWSRVGVGFGEITLVVRDGRLKMDTECMGEGFVLDVVQQAIHEAFAAEKQS